MSTTAIKVSYKKYDETRILPNGQQQARTHYRETTRNEGYDDFETAKSAADAITDFGTEATVGYDRPLYYIDVESDLAGQWANQYKVTFNSSGGSSPIPAEKMVTVGALYGTLPEVTKDGYTFFGWWTAPDGGGSHRLSSTTVSLSGNETLYAKWVEG